MSNYVENRLRDGSFIRSFYIRRNYRVEEISMGNGLIGAKS